MKAAAGLGTQERLQKEAKGSRLPTGCLRPTHFTSCPGMQPSHAPHREKASLTHTMEEPGPC